MNAEQMLKRNREARSRAVEMQAIMEAPLAEDATQAEMVLHIIGLHKLIQFLAESLAAQGQSLINANQAIVEIKGDLLQEGIAPANAEGKIVTDMTPQLVGFDRKKAN